MVSQRLSRVDPDSREPERAGASSATGGVTGKLHPRDRRPTAPEFAHRLILFVKWRSPDSIASMKRLSGSNVPSGASPRASRACHSRSAPLDGAPHVGARLNGESPSGGLGRETLKA